MVVIDDLGGAQRVRIHPVGSPSVDVDVTGPLPVPAPAIVEELHVAAGKQIRHWVIHPDGRVEVGHNRRGYTETADRKYWLGRTAPWATALARQWRLGMSPLWTQHVQRCLILSEWLSEDIRNGTPALVPSPSALVVHISNLSTLGSIELRLVTPCWSAPFELSHRMEIRPYRPDQWELAYEDGLAFLNGLEIDVTKDWNWWDDGTYRRPLEPAQGENEWCRGGSTSPASP